MKIRRLFAPLLLLAAASMAFAIHAAEGDFQPIPKLEKRVTDLTATLSAADESHISERIKQFEAQKGAQIAVLIVPTTSPEPIFDYSLRVAEAWKLGRKGVDDGVLFVVAKNDRKLQILTGPGLQGTLTDAMAKRIIAETVSPKFRSGDFAGGIDQGVEKIVAVLQGEALPAPPQKRVSVQSTGSGYENLLMMGFFAALIAGPLLRSLLGRFVGAAATGGITGAAAWFLAGGLAFPLIAAAVVFFIVLVMGAMGGGRSGLGNIGGLGGLGGFGGGGSSGGSSGGFSGGGGSFDGGGASGSW